MQRLCSQTYCFVSNIFGVLLLSYVKLRSMKRECMSMERCFLALEVGLGKITPTFFMEFLF